MKKRVALFLVIIIIAISLVAAVLHRPTSVARAAAISSNAEKMLGGIKSVHIIRNNSFYENGSIVRGVREEIWVDISGKYCGISDYNTPDGSIYRDILIKNDEGTVLFSCGADGSYSYAQLFKNTSPFPGDERNYNPIYEGYITQLSKLLDSNNFQTVSQESVNGRKSLKIKMHLKSEETEDTDEYWYVDMENSLLLKEEIYQDGILKYKSDVELIEMNPEISETQFNFTIPENLSINKGNLEVIDQKYKSIPIDTIPAELDYKPVMPEYLPDGYKLEEVGYVIDEPAVWQNPFYLTYEKEDQYIYICEDGVRISGQGDPFYALGLDFYNTASIELADTAAYLYPKGCSNGTLYIDAGGLKVKITGNADFEELKKVAESIYRANNESLD